MANEKNLQIQKSCILLNTDEVSVLKWRKHIAKNWKELTHGLKDGYIVILGGRHGQEDGQIGKEDPAIQRHFSKQIQLLEENPEVKQDMEKNNIKIEMVDVCNYYDKDAKLNLGDLMRRLTEIDPFIIVISICHSVNLDLRFALEVEGLFAHMRIQRDLNLTTNGKQITLDPTQKELLKQLAQLAKEKSDPTTVVITGPEGSGKSLLAVEATKMKICSLLKQHPGKDRVEIRVVLCAAYQGENRVPILFQFLKQELKYFDRYCDFQIKPLADLPFNNVQDLQSQIQNKLSIDPPVYAREDDILFTQLLPVPKLLKETKKETEPDFPSNFNQIVPNQQVKESEGEKPGDTILPQKGTEIEVKIDLEESKSSDPNNPKHQVSNQNKGSEDTRVPQETKRWLHSNSWWKKWTGRFSNPKQQVSNQNKGSEDTKVLQKTATEVRRDKHTIVLLDEVKPDFDLHQWRHLKSDSNTEYVVAIRHTFSQSAFPNIRPLKNVERLENSNTLICVLDKRLRCSNEIIALVFYLMIHSNNTISSKSFEHSLDSFNGCLPIWLDVEDVEDSIYFVNETYFNGPNQISPESVMVIYDPNDDQFSLQPLMKYCLDKKWPCYPCTSIVGSEALTVFLYNLKEFHFESFTRVTTNLIIITLKGKETKNQ